MAIPEFSSLDNDALALAVGYMPDSMIPVIDVLGLKNTFAFIKAFAGQVFVMPKHPRGPGFARFSKIESAIGIDAALQLGKEFGGEKLSVPRLVLLSRKLRNQKIIKDFDSALEVMSAGNAVNELATKYGLTWRQIEMIVNDKRVNPSTA